jgi:hypothetical protein
MPNYDYLGFLKFLKQFLDIFTNLKWSFFEILEKSGMHFAVITILIVFLNKI